jgi:uncharacterized protein
MSVTSHYVPCETKFAGVALDAVDKDGTFSGYASLFGAVDLGKDMVERGAFAKSLRRRGSAGIRMLFQHDPNEPIGAWQEIREDWRGLFVKGRLAIGVSKARETLELMRAGALDGLSIGFRTIKAKAESTTGVRHILEADLWEISVVTFPMLPGARVEAVKAARQFPTVRQFEHWLRRDAGLTRTEALGVIARGFNDVAHKREAALNSNPLVRRLKDAASLMQTRI